MATHRVDEVEVLDLKRDDLPEAVGVRAVGCATTRCTSQCRRLVATAEVG